MRRLAVYSLVLMILLSGTLLLKSNFNVIAEYGSSETIQILSDGSISPLDAPIQSVDNVTYVLLDNIQYVGSGNAVEVLRDGVVFEGNGFSLEGNGTGVGICVRGFSSGQITIQNATVQNFDTGIRIQTASSNTIQGNRISNSTTNAIEILESGWNSIYENEIEGAAYGVYIRPSTIYYYNGYNDIRSNHITNSNMGIYCRSPENYLILNTISSSNSSGINIINSNGNEISGNVVSDCKGFSGIQLSNSPNCWLLYNNLTNNLIGVTLTRSNNTVMEGNTFFNDGLFVLDSYHNSIYSNLVNNKPLMYLEDISYGEVNDAGQVVLVNCENIQVKNLELNNATHGIELFNSRYCVISRNRIFENNIGLYLYGSSENTFLENGISFNPLANVFLAYSSDNLFYHNNFVTDTGKNVVDSMLTSRNVWDVGYPIGGNYWSDYNGTDENEDGFGDIPYVIDGNNTDNYPLMYPWEPKLSVHNLNSGLRYETIQEAIDAPETMDGHTISVEEGTYYENLVIDKALSLVGQDLNKTIVDGNFADNTVVIAASNVSISGFTIRNSGTATGDYEYGIYLVNCNDTTISGNSISDNPFGIALYNSSNNEISANDITKCEYGVWINYDSYDNIVNQNSINDNFLGLIFFEESSNIVLENNFRSDGVVVASYGYAPSPNGNTVVDNFVNEKPLIYLEEQSNLTMDGDDVGQVILVRCTNVAVENMNISDTTLGVELLGTNNTTIRNSSIKNSTIGIYLLFSSSNTIYGNEIAENSYGISLDTYCLNNTIYHNNFVENDQQVSLGGDVNNVWDNGYEGNFWSDYTGSDADGDGIGDSPYTILGSNIDNYPLIAEYDSSAEKSFNVTVGETDYSITAISNSTISDLNFNQTSKQLSFNVTGPSGTTGFCNITVPAELMSGDFTLSLDDTPLVEGLDYTTSYNGTHYVFSITYVHSSHMIELVSTQVVPDFAAWLLLPFLMSTTLLGLALRRRLKKEQPTRNRKR